MHKQSKILRKKLVDKLKNDLKKTIGYIKKQNLDVLHIEYKNFIKKPNDVIDMNREEYRIDHRVKSKPEKLQLIRKQIYPNINFNHDEFNFYYNYLESIGLCKNL